MSLGKYRTIHRDLRMLFSQGVSGGLADGQLLERFATVPGEVGEQAFALLIARHGPMVLRVCRSLLHDFTDRPPFRRRFSVPPCAPRIAIR